MIRLSSAIVAAVCCIGVMAMAAFAESAEDTGLLAGTARVEITPQGLEDVVKADLKLLPGMPAEVLINTGERTLLEYLIDPFSNLVARSFIED